MKASIIISSYNEKKYLIQAIESCLHQDFRGDYEIIIGDDGSTDGSVNIIINYVKKHPNKIKFFQHERNDGVYYAGYRMSHIREQALSIAAGEYLLILDGDDVISSDKLSKQVEFLERNKSYVACFTDFETFTSDSKSISKFSFSSIKRSVFWSNYYAHLSCFVFRRQVTEYFVDDNIDDNLATLSILKSGSIYHIPGVTFSYRHREESVWHQYDAIEQSMINLSFVQQALERKYFISSTFAKCYRSFSYLYKNRERLIEDRYSLYFIYHKDMRRGSLIENIKNYDNLSLQKKIFLHSFRAYSGVMFLLFKCYNRLSQKLSLFRF